ncbi:Hypothetical predicted protein [Olea europaea subsp. europaea]|uniref:Uncharacterized protein n=1 Tax=Olea europaea subsp. europaea TaxID=158383 RepID=A0A8S0QFK9_OLEEU|nr:Hypothetical predicted protein [Olea europaea subsp. europaea]
MKDILYKKPLQPHVREDMQFGDTGDAGTSAPVQSPNRPRLLNITDGCKGHSSDVEDDDDDDFVDTPPKRKKTPSHFHPPTDEHATQEYYPMEPEGHDIHTSPQQQATHVDDEPQPVVFDKLREELRGPMIELQCTNQELTVQLKNLKSQLLDLKRDRNGQIDQLIRVQGEIRLDMTKIWLSMTFLSDFVTALITSMMDAIVAKATKKSEVHSVGDAPQQEKVTDIQQNIDRKDKGKMDPADEIEYSSFPPTPSFNLGVASTPIIFNEVDAIIAGVVKYCEIEEQANVATKTINEDQVLLIPLHTFMGHKHLIY